MLILQNKKTYIKLILVILGIWIGIEIFKVIDWFFVYNVSIILFVCAIILYNPSKNKENKVDEVQQLDLSNSNIELRDYYTLASQSRKSMSLLEQIKMLGDIEFEAFMAYYFEREGFVTECTKATADGGKDVIIRKCNELYYVECKRYTKGNVGREAIQKLVGASHADHAKPIFVTTTDYNKRAIEEARKSNVVLINGERLVELIKIQMEKSKLRDTKKQE